MKKQREAILERVLQLVPYSGWGEQTLKEAAKEALGKVEYADALFPEGIAECIDFFAESTDEAMLKAYRAATSPKKIRDRITQLVLARLALHEPHKEAVRQLLSYYGLPHHQPQAMRNLHQTVDAMWHEAGDTATDYNYYTKRLLLAGVYSSTLLCWIHDESAGHQVTHDFLARRIDNVMQIEKWKGGLKQKFANFPSFRSARF